MTRPKQLQDLERRLSEAEGASMVLDAEITVVLRIKASHIPDWADENFPEWRARSDGRVEVVHSDGKGGLHWKAEPYTASLDASLRLVEEVFQCPRIRIDFNFGRASAIIKDIAEDPPREDEDWPTAKTPALALLLALVRALIAKDAGSK